MNLKEYAEQNGMSLADAKELTGLTHWNATVPESCDEIPEVPEDEPIIESVSDTTVSEIVIETKSKEECPVSMDILKLSLAVVGNKSPYWEWRHLVK